MSVKKKAQQWSVPLEAGDYYNDESGLMVFTAQYLLKRGHCCESGCRHCPYDHKTQKNKPENG